VLVLDLSMSMLAQDLKPDRLTRVRYRLMDVLEQTLEGQVGLVAYAGDAYVVAPLTSDTNTIANMLPALQPDIIPVSGSRADRGLALAAELLQRSGAGNGEILLVTDSVRAVDVEQATRLAASGMVVSVLAVGTREGAPVPSGNGFVSDAQGNVVIARLDLAALRELATAGQGRLSVLDSSSTAELPWKAGDGSEFNLRDGSLGERWRDMGPWLVLALLPFAALAFRRGMLFALLLVIGPGLFAPPSAQAGWWDDLWQRRDQQAQQALAADQAAAAAGLARDPSLSGEAWYRSGDYARAAEAYNRVQDAQGFARSVGGQVVGQPNSAGPGALMAPGGPRPARCPAGVR
jgi:Ca-activated chloride channel family protein